MWQPGRQGSGYAKLLLGRCRWPVNWDLWLLQYKLGSYITVHRDPVEGKQHYRLNVELWRAAVGGEFHCTSDGILFRWWRFVLFRPDVGYHSVSQIKRGTRYVLSFGVAW